jgi:hypothetical protein
MGEDLEKGSQVLSLEEELGEGEDLLYVREEEDGSEGEALCATPSFYNLGGSGERTRGGSHAARMPPFNAGGHCAPQVSNSHPVSCAIPPKSTRVIIAFPRNLLWMTSVTGQIMTTFTSDPLTRLAGKINVTVSKIFGAKPPKDDL